MTIKLLKSTLVLFAFLAVIFVSPSVRAEKYNLLGEFGAWFAFSVKQNGKTKCHLESDPIKETGKYTRRGDTFVQVTGPWTRRAPTVAIIAGYTYKTRSKVTTTISDNRFRLTTQGDIAWANHPTIGARMIRAMKKGRRMVVKGRSNRGTRTVDFYSLIGFTAAIRAARRACRQS